MPWDQPKVAILQSCHWTQLCVSFSQTWALRHTTWALLNTLLFGYYVAVGSSSSTFASLVFQCYAWKPTWTCWDTTCISVSSLLFVGSLGLNLMVKSFNPCTWHRVTHTTRTVTRKQSRHWKLRHCVCRGGNLIPNYSICICVLDCTAYNFAKVTQVCGDGRTFPKGERHLPWWAQFCSRNLLTAAGSIEHELTLQFQLKRGWTKSPSPLHTFQLRVLVFLMGTE